MDVRKYFDSIDHGYVEGAPSPPVQGPAATGAAGRRHRQLRERRRDAELPIGNLTSQFFANHYLGVLDHHVKQTLGCRRYVRYMDDFVVWDSEKDWLRQVRDDVAGFLRDSLHLELKPVCLNGCSMGLTFLGYRVFPWACPAGCAEPETIPPQVAPVP